MLLFYFLDILGNIFRVFERFFNRSDCNRDFGFLLLILSLLKIQNVWISLIQTGFVDDRKPKCFFVGVGPFRFEEIFDGADGRDVVGDEGFDLGLEVDHLRFVHGDVFEKILDFLVDFERFLVLWVVLAGDLEVVFVGILVAFQRLLVALER